MGARYPNLLMFFTKSYTVVLRKATAFFFILEGNKFVPMKSQVGSFHANFGKHKRNVCPALIPVFTYTIDVVESPLFSRKR
jgi:hypothetical protein